MNILITGCNGQLGNEMRVLSTQYPQHNYFFSDIVTLPTSEVFVHILDITKQEEVNAFVQEHHIDLIVNCAAYTQVDKAEEDELTAMRINAEAVQWLGSTGCKVIHISTDYVFSGCEHIPCKEDDPVAPNTAYGRTKLAGEQKLLEVNPQAIILRTAWLYSSFGNNFVKTMLRLGSEREQLGVVFDQIGTPTYAADLAQAIFHIINAPQWHAGIYHFTNEGVCSWYDFTVAIHQIANTLLDESKQIQCNVQPILSSAYAYKTPRPHYSVLDKSKYKQTFQQDIPYWTEALNRCLKLLINP